MQGDLDIEFEQDWSVGLVAMYAMDRKWKTIFLVSGIFPGIADSVILLRCWMYYKPTQFDENRWSHFWENEYFNFFLCELPLILRVGWKLTYGLEIFERGPYI